MDKIFVCCVRIFDSFREKLGVKPKIANIVLIFFLCVLIFTGFAFGDEYIVNAGLENVTENPAEVGQNQDEFFYGYQWAGFLLGLAVAGVFCILVFDIIPKIQAHRRGLQYGFFR